MRGARLRDIGRVVGRLFEHGAHPADFCTCCAGDGRLRRCEALALERVRRAR